MKPAAVLDVFEQLLTAAAHPDIVDVSRYGKDVEPGGQSPAGVCVKHQSGSEAYLWVAAARPEPTPCPIEGGVPAPKFRAHRLLRLVLDLLDVAKPDVFTGWAPCAFPGVYPDAAAGLRVAHRDGGVTFLRVTAGAGPAGDPTEEPFPDYTIPEGVKEWHLKASAVSATPR